MSILPDSIPRATLVPQLPPSRGVFRSAAFVNLLFWVLMSVGVKAQSPDDLLIRSAQAGNLDSLEIAIGLGANLEAITIADSATALFHAATGGYVEIMERLLAAGADIEATDKFNWTPLHEAAFRGKAEAVRLLIERGADVNARTNKNETPALMPLSRPGETEIDDESAAIVFQLLDAGTDATITNVAGWGILHSSAIAGRLDLVQRVVELGADVNHVNRDRMSPLLYAARNANEASALYLLSHGAKPGLSPGDPDNELHYAASKGNPLLAIRLLDLGLDVDEEATGWTPLAYASRDGHTTTAMLLMQAGADVNHVIPSGFSALSLAAWNNQTEITRRLVCAGANIDHKNAEELTPRELALDKGFNETAAAVLEPECDQLPQESARERARSARDADLRTAVSTGDLVGMQKALIRGANINTTTPTDSATVVMTAAGRSHIATMTAALDAGADVHAVDRDGWTALHWAVHKGQSEAALELIKRGASTDARTHKNETPLLLAQRFDQEEMARILVPVTDSLVTDDVGWTSLHYVAREDQLELMDDLVQKGAQVSVAKSDGWTPLMLAANNGYYAIVAYLACNGADPARTNNEGQTALDIAIQADSYSERILERGCREDEVDNIVEARKQLKQFTVALNLYDFAAQDEHSTKAVELLEAITYDRDPIISIAYNARAIALDNIGKEEESAVFFEKAAAASTSAWDGKGSGLYTIYGNLALAYQDLDDEEAAIRSVNLGIQSASLVHGDSSIAKAQALRTLAGIYRWFGRKDDAFATIDQSLGILQAKHDESHIALARAYNEQARIHYVLDDYQSALGAIQLTLQHDSLRLVDSPDDLSVLGELPAHYNRLATIQNRLDLYTQAVESADKSIAEAEKYMARDSETFAYAYETKSYSLRNLSRYEEALASSMEALRIYRKYRDESDQYISDSEFNIAKTKSSLFHAFDDTRPWFENAIRKYRADAGRQYSLADALAALGSLYESNSFLKEADSLLNESIQQYERLEDENYWALPLYSLARVKERNGEFGEAISLRKRNVVIDSLNYGASHSNTLSSILFLARTLAEAGMMNEANEALARVDVIVADTTGDKQWESDDSFLNQLWIARGDVALMDDRLPDARHAGKIRLQKLKQDFNVEHYYVGLSHSFLADVFKAEGRYRDAQAHLDSALVIAQSFFGPEHPEVANVMVSSSEVHQQRGNYVQARALLEKSLAIKTDRLGADHVDVAIINMLLSELLLSQGDYVGAVDNARLAEEIFLSRLAPSAGVVERTVMNRAIALERLGRLEEAETILFDPAEKELSSNSRTFNCAARNNLARVRIKQGQPEIGAEMLTQCMREAESYVNPSRNDELDVIRVAENLAWANEVLGKLDLAVMLYDGAVEKRTAIQGAAHPSTIDAASNSIRLSILAGKNKADLVDRAIQNARLTTDHVERVFPTLSLAEQRSFVDIAVPLRTSGLLSACDSDDCLQAAYEFLFRWKGLLLNSLRRESGLQRLEDVPEVASLLAILEDTRSEIASLYQRPDRYDPAVLARQTSVLQQRKEETERELARELPEDLISDVLEELGLDGFRSLMEPDEAFVDIYRFNDQKSGTDRYVAVVTSRSISPRRVDLGEAELLDEDLEAWRSAVTRGLPADLEWSDLKDDIWTTLANALPETAKKIWISPDGRLARLPWNLFEIGAERRVVQIDSGRELAYALRQSRSSTKDGFTLVGGVDFDAGGTDSTRLQLQFAELPGTATEVAAVSLIAANAGSPPVVLTGSDATKPVVLSALSESRFAHLATHGFFYGESETVYGTRGAAATSKSQSGSRSTRNPLVESGLALTGANSFDAVTGEPLGLLTAEELIGLDLSGSEMIVLSACETGRGAEVTGQGVMGLRASLLTAGARTVLMSLWKVPDESTSLLMKYYYEGLLENDLSPADALEQAQVKVRDDESGLYTNPIHWAAWVLVGEGWQRRQLVDESVETEFKDTIIKYAQDGDERIFDLVDEDPRRMNVTDENGATPIMWAAFGDHPDIVKGLVDRGAGLGGSGVIYSDNQGSYLGSLLAILAAQDRVDLIKHIVETRAANIDAPEWNPNDRKRNGWTPLIWAAQVGNVETVKYLLSAGAAVNHVPPDRATAYWIAVSESHEEVVRILISAGADTNPLNADGTSLLHYKSHDSALDIMDLLVENGADIDHHAHDDGQTPIHWAASNGQVLATQKLIDFGADVNALGHTGWTALHAAASSNHADAAAILIRNGTDIDIQNRWGETALFIAANGGHIETVELLLCAGANTSLANEDGNAPRYWARRNGHYDIVDLLDAGCASGAAAPVSESE